MEHSPKMVRLVRRAADTTKILDALASAGSSKATTTKASTTEVAKTSAKTPTKTSSKVAAGKCSVSVRAPDGGQRGQGERRARGGEHNPNTELTSWFGLFFIY